MQKKVFVWVAHPKTASLCATTKTTSLAAAKSSTLATAITPVTTTLASSLATALSSAFFSTSPSRRLCLHGGAERHGHAAGKCG